MDLGKGLGHLTYSTLVHPGDNWNEIWTSLTTYVPKVKARIAPNEPFGVSLRLAAESAQALVSNRRERDKLKKFLADNDMYPSIQSAPLGFKPRVTGPEVVASYTEHVLRVAAHLIGLQERTGRTVGLALEPEPFCFLETTDETIEYFTKHLYSGAAAATVARLAGIPISEAHSALRRHVGMVFDICHQAVAYENIAESLQKLVDAGIPIFKLQEAAALYIPQVTDKTIEVLRRYADTIYLTQTVEKKDGRFTKFLNLEDAFAAWKTNPGPREWRTHIHVPVFLDDLGAFRTTRFAIEDALKFHKANPVSRQLEIETYTWDVLPDSLKTGDIVDYVCRELEWVQGQLR